VGYGEGGLLTEAVWRSPHSLVLLGRIDQAHTQVLELLASAFATGQLADGSGKTVRMTECVFVMTTSAPLEDLPNNVRVWLDDTIGFNPLTSAQAPALARLALRRSAGHLAKSLLLSSAPPEIELDSSAEAMVGDAFISSEGALSIYRHVEGRIIGALVQRYSAQDWSGVRRVVVRGSAGAYQFDILT